MIPLPLRDRLLRLRRISVAAAIVIGFAIGGTLFNSPRIALAATTAALLLVVFSIEAMRGVILETKDFRR